jgi:protein-disulfide isomerase
MSFLKLNRAIIVCAALGLFVAMVLSFQHAFEREVPCLAGKGCVLVASHPSSYIGRIPVAYFGAFGYFAILCMAACRAVLGTTFRSQLTLAGFLFSAFGFLSSWYLQYVSKFIIFAFCPWCFTSAIVMTVLFVLHAKLYSFVGKAEDVEQTSRPDAIVASLGVAVAIISSFGLISTQSKLSVMNETVSEKQSGQLVAQPGNILGDETASVTLVEFADLCCPACRKGFPKLMQYKQTYGNKIRVVYRHFPLFKLPGHEMSPLATVAAEVAAETGKFWQFASAFTSTEEAAKTPDEVFDIAEGVGVSRASIEKAAADSNSPAALRVIRDQECAIDTLKVGGTPTYFLQYNGKTKKLDGKGLDEEMSNPEVLALLK